jgi:hypothetical protein
MFRASPRPSSGAYNCTRSLWFYLWREAAGVLLVAVAGWPDHDQQHCYHHAPTVKPEAATAVVELLMMGVRMPETCRAVYNMSSKKLEKLLYLVG